VSISATCPTCSAKFTAPDDKAGRTAKCPKCGEHFVIPGEPRDRQPKRPPSVPTVVAAEPRSSGVPVLGVIGIAVGSAVAAAIVTAIVTAAAVRSDKRVAAQPTANELWAAKPDSPPPARVSSTSKRAAEPATPAPRVEVDDSGWIDAATLRVGKAGDIEVTLVDVAVTKVPLINNLALRGGKETETFHPNCRSSGRLYVGGLAA
jgi:DNA-directed RNA polymerase subunit RPC12/RpoP